MIRSFIQLYGMTSNLPAERLLVMRMSLLVLTAILLAAAATAQPTAPPTTAAVSSTAQDFNLPVSLDRIRGRLEQPPAITLRVLMRGGYQREERQPTGKKRPGRVKGVDAVVDASWLRASTRPHLLAALVDSAGSA